MTHISTSVSGAEQAARAFAARSHGAMFRGRGSIRGTN